MTVTVVKVEELVAHPAKDQLHGVDYCLNSNPSWRMLRDLFYLFS